MLIQDGSDNNSKQPPANKAQQIQNIKTIVNGTTITISYDLLTDATVTALVCSTSGVVYRLQSQTGQTGDHCQMKILCNGLRRGQYVLYMNVNGQVTSQTVNL